MIDRSTAYVGSILLKSISEKKSKHSTLLAVLPWNWHASDFFQTQAKSLKLSCFVVIVKVSSFVWKSTTFNHFRSLPVNFKLKLNQNYHFRNLSQGQAKWFSKNLKIIKKTPPRSTYKKELNYNRALQMKRNIESPLF